MSISLYQKNKILNKTNGICAYCGKELDLNTMTIDHYIPSSKEGINDISNLYPLCSKCNVEKDSKIYYGDECYPLLNVSYTPILNKLYEDWEKKFICKLKREGKEIEILLQNNITIRINIKKQNIGMYAYDGIIQIGKFVYKMYSKDIIPKDEYIRIREIELNEWVRIRACSIKFNT